MVHHLPPLLIFNAQIEQYDVIAKYKNWTENGGKKTKIYREIFRRSGGLFIKTTFTDCTKIWFLKQQSIKNFGVIRKKSRVVEVVLQGSFLGFHSPHPQPSSVSSMDFGQASLPPVYSLEHKALQE